MGFKMGMDARMVFSNSLLLNWMFEVLMKYVTLLNYIYIYIFCLIQRSR